MRNKSKWIAVVLCMALFGTMAMGSGESEVATGDVTVEPKEDGVEAQVEETTEAANADVRVKVGEYFEKNGLKVEILDYNPDYKEYNQWSTPADGMKYIAVTFNYTNTDTDGTKYVSIYDYSCYADDVAVNQAYIGDDNFMNDNISVGRSRSFTTYYEVPVNANKIELEYSETFSLDNTRIIIELQ